MRISKSLSITTLPLVLVLAFTAAGLAHGNDRGQAKAEIGKAQVAIDYGRPTLKGRDMLKRIQPGQVWRLGSDAATTIESNVDLDFGGTRVPKGKHILLGRLAEPGKWTLIVSSKSAMQYEPGAKIAEVPMEFSEVSDPVEELSIKLSNEGGRGVIEIEWGSARLKATFAVAK
jgi:hypothetical protein